MRKPDLTKHELFQQLINNPDFVEDILALNNIRTREGPLGPDIAGMVYKSRRGTYVIVVNQMLDFEERQFVFLHELYHVLYEFDGNTTLLRLDMTREELVADTVAEIAVAAYGDGTS